MERILIVEDDATISEQLKILLQSNGYIPVSQPPCELALLDVGLPGENGFEICRNLKKNADIPVIFLTAHDSTEDEICGFSAGGDDFVRKPYNADVLLARIARLLRHSAPVQTVKGLTVDENTFTMSFGGHTQSLTKNELRIMTCLMKKPVCTKDEIIDYLWNDSCYIDENALYVNINRIREKLRSMGAGDLLRNIRGVGYSL